MGGPAPAFPREDLERGIPARFEGIAAVGPDRLAVISGDEALTYRAMNAAANRLARAIRASIGPAADPWGWSSTTTPPRWWRSSPR